MIPSRKTRIQLNRLFDSEEEMQSWVKNNYPNAAIKRFWPVHNLACIIEIEAVKETPKKKGHK